MEVDEDAQQDLLAFARARWFLVAEHVADLVGVVSYAELVSFATERFEPLGAHEIDPADGEYEEDHCDSCRSSDSLITEAGLPTKDQRPGRWEA